MDDIYLKIRMNPERFWVRVAHDDYLLLKQEKSVVRGSVANNCVEWPFKSGDQIPLTGETEILEEREADDALEAEFLN